jgi:thiol-disulfide isomerase/thioredoxin
MLQQLFDLTNQYSYILVSFGALCVLAGFLRLRGVGWRVVTGVVGGSVVALVVGYIVLRPLLVSDATDSEQALRTIGNGRPTLVQFYSNYCGGCLTLSPLMDSLTERISGDYNILRVDIHTESGRILRARYGFSFTPEFVLFAPNGQETWRGHLLPSDADLAGAR